MRIHNDSINVELYDIIAEYVTKIPSFPNSLKIKKSDEEELLANIKSIKGNTMFFIFKVFMKTP